MSKPQPKHVYLIRGTLFLFPDTSGNCNYELPGSELSMGVLNKSEPGKINHEDVR